MLAMEIFFHFLDFVNPALKLDCLILKSIFANVDNLLLDMELEINKQWNSRRVELYISILEFVKQLGEGKAPVKLPLQI